MKVGLDAKEYWTLGKGGKAKKFWATSDEKGLILYTGVNGTSVIKLSAQQIDDCLQYFSPRGWFILGNVIDYIKPGGLGEYFSKQLRVGAKAASHFAAVMVAQEKMERREGPHGRIELRVKR